MVLIYVNDIAIAEKGISGIVMFKHNLSKNFEITNMDKLKFILGILVTQGCPNHLIYLNQFIHITQVLARFGILDTKPISIPLLVKYGLSTLQSLSSI